LVSFEISNLAISVWATDWGKVAQVEAGQERPGRKRAGAFVW